MTQHNDNKYCDHKRVNDLLISYESMMESKGIRFEVDPGLDIREVTPMNDDDFFAVFRIALDNAVAGCEALPEGREKHIRVWGKSFPKWIMGICSSSEPVKLDSEWGLPLEVTPEMEYLISTLQSQMMAVGCNYKDGLFRLHFTYQAALANYLSKRETGASKGD